MSKLVNFPTAYTFQVRTQQQQQQQQQQCHGHRSTLLFVVTSMHMLVNSLHVGVGISHFRTILQAAAQESFVGHQVASATQVACAVHRASLLSCPALGHATLLSSSVYWLLC
jgi:hypothetical protein